MSRGWQGGTQAGWRRVRSVVLARDGYQCQIKTPGEWTTAGGKAQQCLVHADCVHHTLGKQTTGDDPDYLVAACTPCNLKVGDPTRTPDPAPRPSTRW